MFFGICLLLSCTFGVLLLESTYLCATVFAEMAWVGWNWFLAWATFRCFHFALALAIFVYDSLDFLL